ncbi:MAG: hydrogen peroxide-inducible genes activator [Gammaproteobacteria bacterium]
MNKLPSTKQLRYFAALARHRHFGKAAEACFVSQPAFSIAIRELESVLNVQLVDRTRKSVTITSIGHDIAQQARLVISDLESLAALARENRESLCGQLKLGVIPTVAPFILPGLLPKLRRSHPALKLYLQEDLTQRLYRRLMEGELDLLLIALPYALRNVKSMPLFKDPFYLAYRKDTGLFEPGHYSTAQLPPESVLLLEDGHCLRDHALSACRIRNVNKISHISASSLLTLVQMVDADLGVTYLPEMARGSYLLKGTRVITSPMKVQSYREIGLVWRQGSRRDEEFRLFGKFIKDNHD